MPDPMGSSYLVTLNTQTKLPGVISSSSSKTLANSYAYVTTENLIYKCYYEQK